MKRLPFIALMLGLVLCLSACSQNDGRFSAKSSDGESLSLRLLDVWQDDAQNVMVTLAGTGKGKLLDVAATPAGRWPMPKVSVRIFAGEE